MWQYTHLDEEVENIAPQRLKVFSADELHKLDAEFLAYVKSHGNPFLAVPFMRRYAFRVRCCLLCL
jgi:hypothetical protein